MGWIIAVRSFNFRNNSLCTRQTISKNEVLRSSQFFVLNSLQYITTQPTPAVPGSARCQPATTNMMASGINLSMSDAMLLLTAAAASAKNLEPHNRTAHYPSQGQGQPYHTLPAVRRVGSGVVPLTPTLKPEFRNDGEIPYPSPPRPLRPHLRFRKDA